jgi:VanZ family protein
LVPQSTDPSQRPAAWSLLVPCLSAAALVLTSPFIGDVRRWLRASFPIAFSWIVAAALATAIAIALIVAVRSIHTQRLRRWSALAMALAVGLVAARSVSGGDLDVDIVEDVHFIEYGVLTLLFYRVWRSRADVSSLVLPVLAAFTVATLDEFLQWFVPLRIGEVRDVWIDLAAIGCGLLFSVAIAPPVQGGLMRRGSATRIGAAGGLAFAAFAWFFVTVHVGHVIRDADTGTFRSRYSPADLMLASSERTRRWQGRMPDAAPGFSREDQYLAEGLWHVRRRNLAWSEGDIRAAWAEQRILERYFAPVAALPEYRWPDAQRADAERRNRDDPSGYVSDAHPFAIYGYKETGFPR